jgi:phosphoglycolate phosphatase-like HAD superfamily hydrolase|tara:strand:+ start:4365 stop:4799 length:435 start_codon:yes stop_codon:yes gene_type:complete
MDIIFDIDGTLMNIEHRKKFVEQRPKDWKSFRELTKDDTPNEDVFAIAIALQKQGHNILIASGRNKSQRAITLMQLMGQKLVFRDIKLRSDKDFRPDHFVKKDMLDQFRAEGWKPELVFDDRTSVVEMWRENGLRAVQVAPGDF